MSEPKLTPWFPGHIKPVRPGVYETRGSSGCPLPFPYLHWGWEWNGQPGEKPSDAKPDASTPLSSEYLEDCLVKWRGLAEPSK
jgi:hypothetical protein